MFGNFFLSFDILGEFLQKLRYFEPFLVKKLLHLLEDDT